MKHSIGGILVLLISSCAPMSPAPQSTDPVPATAPRWFLDEIATLTAGSGRWIADNSAYKSDQEPYDAYGTQWKSSFDGTVMSGRLFGIKDGQEIGNFWEFRQYWHPQRREAVIEQFGWGGTVGIGGMSREGETTRSDQTFYRADGTASRSGHISHFPDAATHITKSFDIDGDTWTPRRSYVWHREQQLTDAD